MVDKRPGYKQGSINKGPESITSALGTIFSVYRVGKGTCLDSWTRDRRSRDGSIVCTCPCFAVRVAPRYVSDFQHTASMSRTPRTPAGWFFLVRGLAPRATRNCFCIEHVWIPHRICNGVVKRFRPCRHEAGLVNVSPMAKSESV